MMTKLTEIERKVLSEALDAAEQAWRSDSGNLAVMANAPEGAWGISAASAARKLKAVKRRREALVSARLKIERVL